MKKGGRMALFSLLTVMLLSSICLGAGSAAEPLTKIYKSLAKDKGENGYIIGNFELLHLMSKDVATDIDLSLTTDLNSYCAFITEIGVVNVKNQKTYSFKLKALPGSATCYYHENRLKDNEKETYQFVAAPPGAYELTNVKCKLTKEETGWYPFTMDLFDVPVENILKQSIRIEVKEKQLIYIGDFKGNLVTYICRNASTIKIRRIFGLESKDNFEAAKTKLMNDAPDEKSRAKLSEYEFVSALGAAEKPEQ